MRKEQYNLDQKLSAIWRCGDRDEMSIKHIGHGIAAMIAFGDWKLAADYRYPDFYDFGKDSLNERAYVNMDERLAPKWAKIQALLDAWGVETFLENLEATNYGFYPISYLEAGYLPYAKQLQVTRA